MNDHPIGPPSGDDDARWEAQVRERARDYTYPPTPDIARTVRARLHRPDRYAPNPLLRLAVAAAVVIAVIAALWSVPEVRAAVRQILRLGAVTVLVGEETATPQPSPERPTPTREPGDPLTSALQLSGETTLEDARAALGDALKLPMYPADLGEPDRVFRQNNRFPLISLVWVQPDDPGIVPFVLQTVNDAGDAMKVEPHSPQPTTVNGHRALWFENPHLLVFYLPSGRGDLLRQISQNVLLWSEGGYTYRLETDQPMDEAIRTAESLH
jgi:hypothetical protein